MRYACGHMSACRHAHNPYMHMHPCTDVCMWAHMWGHVWTRMCMRTRTHMHTHNPYMGMCPWYDAGGWRIAHVDMYAHMWTCMHMCMCCFDGAGVRFPVLLFSTHARAPRGMSAWGSCVAVWHARASGYICLGLLCRCLGVPRAHSMCRT